MAGTRSYYLPLLLLGFLFSLCTRAQTTIEKSDGNWTLIVNNEPFAVKGITFGYTEDVENYSQHFKNLRSMGVNTIRIWATDENTSELLDVAHTYGIKVMVGIWMRHGRPGMEADDSFNYLEDNSGMEDMYNNAISVVESYKDHPALLMWGIGNEVYLNTATDDEKEAYSKLLEKICADIKTLDNNHPIASVEAWTFGLDWWEKLVPSLDIYGINCYGPGADLLQDEIDKKGIEKPYVITEFGVTGEWDAQEDTNGIKIEPDDNQKYEAIASGYHQWIKDKPSCLGVYIFHYADGDQFIAPWLFTHYRGMYRPQYWAVRKAYSGKDPINRVPEVKNFQLPDNEINSGEWVPVSLSVTDTEQETLAVSFRYNQRTGSRKRRDQLLPLPTRGNIQEGFEIQLPQEHGAIKVYVNVNDTYGNVGIASTSIKVIDEERRSQKFLVPKASLPFYVYKDGTETPYISSAHMGNYEAIAVDLDHRDEVYSGTSSLKITYGARKDWYGVGFVDPPNDWGDILGGYDLSGAKTFSFWAKADDNVKATIGFGLIDSDKPFPDTAKKSVEVSLSTKWKKYKINLKRLDMSCIRSGLVVFSSSKGFPHNIYLDDVVFE